MREYRLNMSNWGIDRDRYVELKARCRQYPTKKMQAQTLLGVGSPSLSGMPHGSGTSNPVARAAEKRDRLLRWCEPIEYAASRAAGGRYYQGLIQSCCEGVAFVDIDPTILPTSDRTKFFQARREFFWLLDKRLEELE